MNGLHRILQVLAGPAVIAALLAVWACGDRGPTLPGVTAAARASSGDPTVTSTDPPGSPQDTTLDVHVFGTNFDRGSRADFALGGVVGPKVRTNSTRFVNSTELIANVTIAADADTGKYDVLVTTSTGKKGIGTEMFVIDVADPAIAFVKRGTNGNPDKLFVMNASGTHQTAIATGASFSFGHPSWSPNAGSIVFGGTIGGQSGMWIIDVAVVNGTPGGTNLRRILDHGGSPAWMPTGDTIAFAHPVSDQPYQAGLWLVAAAGGTPVLIYTAAIDRSAEHPDWSPDGTKLVFMQSTLAPGDYRWSLLIFDRITTAVDTIVPLSNNFYTRFPAWSRGGDRIAFSGYSGSNPEAIYTVPPIPHASLTQIVTGYAPAWSPNDGKLAFNGSKPGAVYTYDFATRVRQRLSAQARTAPDWRRF